MAPPDRSDFSMRLLASCARSAAASPRWVLALTVVVIAVSLLLALRLKISTDISVLMPEDSRISGAFLQALEDFGTTDKLIVVVESTRGPDEAGIIENRRAMKELATSLAEEMDRSGLFESVTFRVTADEREFFESLYFGHPFHYHSAEALAALRDKLTPEAIDARVAALHDELKISPLGISSKRQALLDPLGFRAGFRSGYEDEALAGFRFDLSDGYYFAPDSRALMIVARPTGPSQDTAFDAALLEDLERILTGLGGPDRLREDYSMRLGDGLEVHLFGPYVETLYGAGAVQKELLPSLGVTLVGLVILFAVAYRGVKTLLLLAVPLLTGIVITFGIASVFAGHLSVVTVGFAAMLAGLGVDFGIHLVDRVGEQSRAGAEIGEAITTAFATTGKGVLAGAITSVGIFALIAASEFAALRELGLIVGLGILATLTSMVFLLPVLILRFARPRNGRRPPLTLDRSRLRVRGASWIVAHPRSIIAVGVVLTAVLAVSATRLQFERNIYALGPMNLTYERTKDRVLQEFGASTNVVMAIAERDDLQQLLETTERTADYLRKLKARGEIASFESLSSVLQSHRSQQDVIDTVRAWDLPASMAAFEAALREAGFRTEPFEPFVHGVLDYDSGEGVFVDLDDLQDTPAEAVVERFLARDGERWRSVTYVYPRSGEWEDEIPPAVVDALADVDPDLVLTGIVPSFDEITRHVRRDFGKLTVSAAVAVFLIALAFYRKPSIAILALLPAVVGLVWTLGAMRLVGIELNLLTILVAPLILGLGIDDAIHLLNRDREQPADLAATLRAVSGAILMTTATTVIGFGSLSFADLPSVAALGITVGMGMIFCAVTSLVLLPAIIASARARRRSSPT